MRQLGAEVDEDGPETVRVRGVGLRGLRAPDEPLDFGNAGTVLRLASGILAGQEGRFELVGDESLSARPQERIAEPLRQMGARVETTEGHAPVVIEGGVLSAIRYELPVASAQVKSACCSRGSSPRAGRPVSWSRTRPGITRSACSASSASGFSGEATRSRSAPVERLPPLALQIAGDFSSAAPFVVAATLLSGSELLVQGVNVNPLRTGLLDVLGRMGSNIAIFNRRSVGGEPVADLEVRSAELTATRIGAEEVPRLIDELPLVALAAGMARGETVVTGAGELRVKETDRIETVTTSLKGLGVRITAGDDGFRVRGVLTRPKGGGVD